jgi:hypothetical protein
LFLCCHSVGICCSFLPSSVLPLTLEKKRHLDRSNAQLHRPLRSGEIPVSRRYRCLSVFQYPLVTKAKSAIYKIIPQIPQQNQPQKQITRYLSTTSLLRRSYSQPAIIELEIKKAPAKNRGFVIKPITHLERRIYPQPIYYEYFAARKHGMLLITNNLPDTPPGATRDIFRKGPHGKIPGQSRGFSCR